MNKLITIGEFIELFNESVAHHRGTNDPIPEMSKDNYGKIEGCLKAPFATFDSKDLYKTVYDKAAILVYLLIKNHPLQNGNKRMAYITLCAFLYKNKIDFTISDDELYNFTKKIASSDANDKDKIIQYTHTILIQACQNETIRNRRKNCKIRKSN